MKEAKGLYFFGVDVAAADCHVPLYNYVNLSLSLYLRGLLEKGVAAGGGQLLHTNITATVFFVWNKTVTRKFEKREKEKDDGDDEDFVVQAVQARPRLVN